jgi:hypothetical protein
MEIGPITGIRVLPVNRATPADPELSAVFDITLSRSGDDTYSGSGRQAAGGQDNESEEPEELLDDEEPATPLPWQRSSRSGISIFA